MSREYFAILGLSPGRYEPRQIARQFASRRRRLLAELDDPARQRESLRQLDELYQAYNVLRDPRRQAEHLRAIRDDDTHDDRVTRLLRIIEAALEGGLLRYSRRVQIIEAGRRLGFSEFHTQLLIAQVQFGGELVVTPASREVTRSPETPTRVGARFAAAGVLALAIFLAMVRWLGT